MKITLILCALAVHAFAAQPVLVRVTPETLAKLQKRDPMIRLVKPEAGEAKVVRPASESLVQQSTILHDGENWTLVPKGAVVFTPESLKSHVNVQPVGKLLSWTAFLAKNRSWIATDELSFDQAAGNEVLTAEQTASWSSQEKIVVTTHHMGPISVSIGSLNTELSKR